MFDFLKLFAYVFVCLYIIFPTPAQAYLDPGTGSIILQALAAGLLGVGVFWRRIVDFVKKIFNSKKSEEE